MREEPTRSLLLLDASADERRLISAVASRAGWSVMGAADEDSALAVLDGPHAREVRAAELAVPLDVSVGTGHSWHEAAH